MWILDGKDHVKDFKSDSLCSRKRLRHLMLRPTICNNISPPSSLFASSYCCSILKTNNALSWDLHPSNMTDLPEINTEPLVSSRWCPTPEQVKALQEMYQRGVRTPSAHEIQLITAKLSQFGKIEGKNVFYWFQNHKARERQKRRRQPDSFSNKQGQDIETLVAKEIRLSCKNSEAELNKKIATTSDSRKLSKKSASMQMAAATENTSKGWISHFDEKEFQQSSKRTANGAISLLDLSCMSTSNYQHLNTITAQSESLEAMKQKVTDALSFKISSPSKDEDLIKLEHRSRENCLILQLFPSRNDDQSAYAAIKRDNKEVNAIMDSNFTPNQFFEFL